MKGVQCYELFGGIAFKSHALFIIIIICFLFVSSRNNPLLPQCLICLTQLTNASMKHAKFSLHLNRCHLSLANKPKEYVEALSESVCYSSSKLKAFLIELNSASGLTASYNIALLIAKHGH